MAIKYGKIITVTSVKGGVGKTTMVLNMAGILAKQNKKVVIVDLDLYSGVVASYLNLKTSHDIYDLTSDIMDNRFDSFDDYIVSYDEHIDVLASPIDPRSSGKIRANYIDIVLARLKMKYDIILIDTNHVIDKINLITLDASDCVFYVMTNDLLDIKNMKVMVTIFEDMDMHKHKIVLNEARLNNSHYSSYDIENLLGDKISYIIPKSFFSHSFEKYVFSGKIMTMDKNYSKNKGTEVLLKMVNDLFE